MYKHCKAYKKMAMSGLSDRAVIYNIEISKKNFLFSILGLICILYFVLEKKDVPV
jgi:hypothetical protein